MPNPDPSATEDGRAVSGDLSPETVAALVDLARVLDPDACDPPAKSMPIGAAAEAWRRQDAALKTARQVWEAGYRLVSEDDTTVDRLAALLWSRLNPRGRAWSELLGGPSEVEFREHARAAVRALREPNSQQTPSSPQAGSSTAHACCPHCTTRTGSCVRCGDRDAADGEELCGQCDTEVAAEIAEERALREAGE
jgi:hypothetical protein